MKKDLVKDEQTEPSKQKTDVESTLTKDDKKCTAEENPVDKPNEVSNDIIEKSVPGEDKSSKESGAQDSVGEDNLHYEDGVCIYTEPESKCQFIWDDAKQEWVPRENSSTISDKDYEFDGKTYTYTDSDFGKFT